MDAAVGLSDALPDDVTQVGLTLRLGVFRTEMEGFGHAGQFFLADGPREGATLDAALMAITARHYFGNGLRADVEAPAGTLRFRPGASSPVRMLSGLGDVRVTGRYDLAASAGHVAFRQRDRRRRRRPSEPCLRHGDHDGRRRIPAACLCEWAPS